MHKSNSEIMSSTQNLEQFKVVKSYLKNYALLTTSSIINLKKKKCFNYCIIVLNFFIARGAIATKE